MVGWLVGWLLSGAPTLLYWHHSLIHSHNLAPLINLVSKAASAICGCVLYTAARNSIKYRPNVSLYRHYISKIIFNRIKPHIIIFKYGRPTSDIR